MVQADRIRQAALEWYILPARSAGQKDITIRAGDLHREMKLTNAMPAVCSALGSGKFELLAGVRRLEVTGPANGANVYFRFSIAVQGEEPGPTFPEPRPELSRSNAESLKPTSEAMDLSDAVVLVSCVKSKLPQPAPARLLYCSDWFTKVRRIIEAQDAHWFVLSALYGLVPADKEIAPYEHTLSTFDIAGRRAWAAGVYRALEPELKGYKRVVFFAGTKYREFFITPLQRGGWRVEVPMEGMGIGEQLAWLSVRQ